jgi:hypothetical protein
MNIYLVTIVMKDDTTHVFRNVKEHEQFGVEMTMQAGNTHVSIQGKEILKSDIEEVFYKLTDRIPLPEEEQCTWCM